MFDKLIANSTVGTFIGHQCRKGLKTPDGRLVRTSTHYLRRQVCVGVVRWEMFSVRKRLELKCSEQHQRSHAHVSCQGALRGSRVAPGAAISPLVKSKMSWRVCLLIGLVLEMHVCSATLSLPFPSKGQTQYGRTIPC